MAPNDITPENWDFLDRLDDAFRKGEEQFGQIGRITIGPEVLGDFKKLPDSEWNPTGNDAGHVGNIWDAEIWVSESLPGKQIILDAPPDASDSP
jgi:hypothetical protein